MGGNKHKTDDLNHEMRSTRYNEHASGVELINICNPFINILLIKKEGVTIKNNGRDFSCHEGDVLVIKKNSFYSVDIQCKEVSPLILDYVNLIRIPMAELNKYHDFIIFSKQGGLSNTVCAAKDDFERAILMVKSSDITQEQKREIETVFTHLKFGATENSQPNQPPCQSSIYYPLLLDILTRIHPGIFSLINDGNLCELSDAVASLICEDYSATWTQEMLARHFHMSVSKFKKKMIDEVGGTVCFIRRIKMIEALRLLKHTHLSVSRISATLGFCSPAYFSTVFKAFYNASPCDLRRQRSTASNQ